MAVLLWSYEHAFHAPSAAALDKAPPRNRVHIAALHPFSKVVQGPSDRSISRKCGAPTPLRWSRENELCCQASLHRNGTAKRKPRAVPIDSSTAVAEETLEELKEYLQRELPKLFTAEGMQIEGRFDDKVAFEDPITRYDSLAGYLFNIALLKLLFSPVLQVHSVYQSGAAEVSTRWTMRMFFRLLPWQPEIIFTGISIYGINPATGRFCSHKDVWDSISDNKYFSREGLLDLIKQCSHLYRSPESLGSPSFTTLLRKADFEVRKYEPFLAASTPVPSYVTLDRVLAQNWSFNTDSNSPTQALEQWAASAAVQSQGISLGSPAIIQVKKETGAGESPASATILLLRPLRLRFPVADLEEISSTMVSTFQVPAQIVAVSTFSGRPRAEEIESEVSRLRASILREGLEPITAEPHSFSAALYQGAGGAVPPVLVRNEVLIPIRVIEWA